MLSLRHRNKMKTENIFKKILTFDFYFFSKLFVWFVKKIVDSTVCCDWFEYGPGNAKGYSDKIIHGSAKQT